MNPRSNLEQRVKQCQQSPNLFNQRRIQADEDNKASIKANRSMFEKFVKELKSISNTKEFYSVNSYVSLLYQCQSPVGYGQLIEDKKFKLKSIRPSNKYFSLLMAPELLTKLQGIAQLIFNNKMKNPKEMIQKDITKKQKRSKKINQGRRRKQNTKKPNPNLLTTLNKEAIMASTPTNHFDILSSMKIRQKSSIQQLMNLYRLLACL